MNNKNIIGNNAPNNLVSLVVYYWSKILDLWKVLKPCRFSLAVLVLGTLFFTIVPQGVDILRATIESNSFFEYTIFSCGVVLWAFSIWYWARHICTYPFIKEAVIKSLSHESSKIWIHRAPILLGATAFLTIGIAFWSLLDEYPSENFKAGDINPRIYVYLFIGYAVGFWLILEYFSKVTSKAAEKMSLQRAHSFTSKIIKNLERWFVPFGAIATLVILLWTAISPVSAGSIGTPSLFFVAASNAAFVGTMFVIAGEKLKIPVFTMLLGAAIFFSIFNDNHEIRTSEEFSKNYPNSREYFFGNFKDWIDARHIEDIKNPIILIAAEGGGIRAAYWSASLLGSIQDNNSEFSRYVYAMSGVSGGSLGISTFAGLLKASQVANTQDENGCNSEIGLGYRTCAENILSEDFLAPVVGRLLYGDLLQRFIPTPVKAFDRGHALELAWEDAWFNHTGTNYFKEPVLELYSGCKVQNKSVSEEESPVNDRCDIPSIFLNSTWVERGQRVIMSNLYIDHDQFITAHDLHSIVEKHIPLSSAIHNSARFSYVSPAGTVKNFEGTVKAHLIDGGYFENSGGTAILEILNGISSIIKPCTQRELEEDSKKCEARKNIARKWKNFIPMVIMITNDPKLNDDIFANVDPNPWMNEIRSPVEGLLNTRDGRGSYARKALKKTVNSMGGYFIEFGLQNVEGGVPLGWMLSKKAKEKMKVRLDCYSKEFEFGLLNIQNLGTCQNNDTNGNGEINLGYLPEVN